MTTKPNLKEIQFLGGGSFGQVFEVLEVPTGINYAVKQISVEKYKFIFKDEQAPFIKIMTEVKLLKQIGSGSEDKVKNHFWLKIV